MYNKRNYKLKQFTFITRSLTMNELRQYTSALFTAICFLQVEIKLVLTNTYKEIIQNKLKNLTDSGFKEGKLLELRFSFIKEYVADELAKAEVEVNLCLAKDLECCTGLSSAAHVLYTVTQLQVHSPCLQPHRTVHGRCRCQLYPLFNKVLPSILFRLLFIFSSSYIL